MYRRMDNQHRWRVSDSETLCSRDGPPRTRMDFERLREVSRQSEQSTDLPVFRRTVRRTPAMIANDCLIVIIVAIYRYAPTPGSARSGNNLQ
jgi:hypothetical protein